MQAALTLRSNLHNLVPTVVKASDGCTCHFEPSLPRQWGPMIGIGRICHSAFTTSSPPPSMHAANLVEERTHPGRSAHSSRSAYSWKKYEFRLRRGDAGGVDGVVPEHPLNGEATFCGLRLSVQAHCGVLSP